MFNVPELRMPAYKSIAMRPIPLTAQEASRLPVDDVTIIYALREYNATRSNKLHALLNMLSMYFVSYYIFYMLASFLLFCGLTHF